MALTDTDIKRIDQLLDRRFVEVRREVKSEVGALSEQISSFVNDNFEPAINSLLDQIGEIRRDMKRMRVVVD